MKTFLRASTKIGMLVLISIAALGASAKAQSLEHKLTARIPFDFSVAGKTFAAGEYTIIRANQTAGDLILKISSSDDQSRVFPVTVPVQTINARNRPALIFHRYGDEYFLAQVWSAGATTGRAFTKSRRERELEKQKQEMARTQKAPMVGTVTILP